MFIIVHRKNGHHFKIDINRIKIISPSLDGSLITLNDNITVFCSESPAEVEMRVNRANGYELLKPSIAYTKPKLQLSLFDN